MGWMDKTTFQELVWAKGRQLYRDMPWRHTDDPYKIMVSELMLQQTQVDRVIPKYLDFVDRFPTVASLAAAPLADVLSCWSGLGYNRRAKFLHNSAIKIVHDFDGIVPSTHQELMSLPGIGANTAAAILAYAFRQPVAFVETNIRTVYFQHYFSDADTVTDAQLQEVVADTIDNEHPREWFWALMDYGSYLKRQGAGQLTKSAHYKRQSALKGSVREVRGMIIRALATADMNVEDLKSHITADERFDGALEALIQEGFVMRTHDVLHLTK